MSKVEEVSAFETTDGKLFVCKKEAEKHQKKLDFNSLCNSLPFYPEDEDIIEWLTENRKKILEFLNDEN